MRQPEPGSESRLLRSRLSPVRICLHTNLDQTWRHETCGAAVHRHRTQVKVTANITRLYQFVIYRVIAYFTLLVVAMESLLKFTVTQYDDGL